jgi:predicted ATPase/DNA-binding SARP family transcriptional activator
MRSASWLWKIELLGGLCVRQEERVLHRFRAQKPGALLAYLAYYPRRPHPREVLIELLWPNGEPQAGRNSLNTALSSLRRQLEPPGIPMGTVLQADRFTVHLNPAAFMTDVAEFHDALRAAGRATGRQEQTQHLMCAVDLYQGELLTGYYEDWIFPEQRRLADLYFEAVRRLTTHLEQEQDLSHALDYARKALRMDTLREEIHQRLMHLYAADGQVGQALRQYAELERVLAEQLGRKPAAATRHLAARVEQSAQESSGEEEAIPRLVPQRESAEHLLTQAPLPTGTVTFLLTDIEGSTRLWEGAGDAFRTALSDHHRLLRTAFARFHGHEAKEMGDAFVVAFAHARDALACAVAGQQALTAHPWPAGVGALRVRMALHTGDVDLEAGEYHGLVLHRAARMLTAGHGEQILCSEVTASLLRRDLPPDTRLTDLGVYRLRDVPTPERLFLAAYPGMPERDFPPPNAEAGYAGSLPLHLTRFLGREAELSRLHSLLDSEHSRLITLSGPGGTGKTRLAVEAAGQSVERFAGAVWFVPLADLGEGRQLPQAILQALRLPPLLNQDPLEQAAEALARQPSLLILDNLEQIADEAAPVIHALLTRAPAVKCLVTSRQRLHIPGEQEFAVAPLPTPNGADTPALLMQCESVRLFVDRAQAVKPDFQVTDRNAAAVAALCDRLEGLPLAIELAAARAQVLPPAQMLVQMEHRFDFLASRQRVTEERHRTLRAAIDWSYQLLDAEAQRLFGRLSVFRGGWTLEAAAYVCEDDAVLDRLTQLREASLVLAEEAGEAARFRMLNLLRAYAEEQLSDTERAHIARRHADHSLALAEEAGPELRGARQIVWLDRLEQEQDNLRAALDWACRSRERLLCARLALAFYLLLYHRGSWQEARRCLEAGLEAAHAIGDSGQALQARLQCDLAGLCFDMGDQEEAWTRARESLATCRERDDAAQLADVLNLMGLLALQSGEREMARQRFLEVLDLRADAHGRALALHNLGRLAGGEDDFGEARRLYEMALLHRRAAGDARGEAETLGSLGATAYRTGEREEARRLYLESLRLYRDVRYPYGAAMMLNNLGELAEEAGNSVAAVSLFAQAERLFGDLHSRHAETPAEALRRLEPRIGAERLEQLRQAAAHTTWERMTEELTGTL